MLGAILNLQAMRFTLIQSTATVSIAAYVALRSSFLLIVATSVELMIVNYISSFIVTTGTTYVR